MGEEQQFCLRWNNFQANITSQFEALRNEEEFVDVTLACDGQRLKAHKVVLSACSPYFKELFMSNPCKHPILFLRDVEFCHLQSLVEFMYAGEVNVAQAQLSTFLRTAESLQIRGLTEAPQHHKEERLSPTQNSVQSPSGSKKASSLGRLSLDEDDDVLSASPPLSPPPAKRACHSKLLQPSLLPPKHEVDLYRDESPEIIEPKMEMPDYSSDGECKMDGASMSGSMFGLDNSVDGNNSLSSLHGAIDMLPGTSSQNFMTDFSQDSSQADLRKLHSLDPRPCPICFRMYSNLSNLRQHVRLIHNPQTVACPLCNKPFKTKLYLKRHLMSFHELACSPTQPPSHPPPDFFPPPPQVVLGPDGPKVKDASEYFHNSRTLNQFPFPFPGDERPYPNGHRNDMKFPNFHLLMDDRGNPSLTRNLNKSAYFSQLLNKSSDGNVLNVMNSGLFKNPETPLPLCNSSGATKNLDTFPYMSIANTRSSSEATFVTSLDKSQEKQQYGALSSICKVEEPTHYQLPESTRNNNEMTSVVNNVHHPDSLKLQALAVNSLDMQSDVSNALLGLAENKRDDPTSFLSPNLLENASDECTANSQAIGN